MFTGVGLIPPASAVNYIPWIIIGFLSQYVIRRRHFPTWAKYNCAAPRLFVFVLHVLTAH